jgi:hypothetical protein
MLRNKLHIYRQGYTRVSLNESMINTLQYTWCVLREQWINNLIYTWRALRESSISQGLIHRALLGVP